MHHVCLVAKKQTVTVKNAFHTVFTVTVCSAVMRFLFKLLMFLLYYFISCFFSL